MQLFFLVQLVPSLILLSFNMGALEKTPKILVKTTRECPSVPSPNFEKHPVMQCTKRYRNNETNAMVTCGQECMRCTSGPQAKNPGKQFWRCPSHGFFAWVVEEDHGVDGTTASSGPPLVPVAAILLGSGEVPPQSHQSIPQPRRTVQVNVSSCEYMVDTALGDVSAAAEAVFAENASLKEDREHLLEENARLKTEIMEAKERLKAVLD
ncbi:hypothetical protein BC830DRAFT_1122215 [Chytriomyces sp. MP71]|nr:hypothetical protein BC830DRAFT_1122215 [Chytriomyces sp. MP71]